jgi:hypothetical protein
MKLRFITSLLGAAAAASIIAAPAAWAEATGPNCTYLNGSANTQCQSPGNVQINDSPPYMTQYPYWGGGYWGGGDRGFHGGGGHR